MKHRTMLILLGLLAALLLSGCAQKTEQAAAGVTIDVSALSAEPTFIPAEYKGTRMEFIARMDESGAPRVALNTCQSCGGSPYAWFEYVGSDTLQCQNCGLTFPTASVGTPQAAGCNPVTVTDFTVEGGTVSIPATVLAEAAPLFKVWKVVD
ncbi:MAG: DUF2318 domain-containing protein [Clostridia bacterium]|nr:DUF2318 domain-containing protein [Clostridia bacterium]